MRHVQHPSIYFCNIKMKQLQRISETLETYICNIREGKPGAGRFRPLRWEPPASRGARAPPAPVVYMGALDSAEEDLRRHDTCAPMAMTGSAACAMAMETDGRRGSERHMWLGRGARAVGEGHDAEARERVVVEGWSGAGGCASTHSRETGGWVDKRSGYISFWERERAGWGWAIFGWDRRPWPNIIERETLQVNSELNTTFDFCFEREGYVTLRMTAWLH
jgi:hypothetical protein